jgi:tRNA(fMet)-specific endonuclease VapC
MILDTNAVSALAGQDKAIIGLVQAAPRVTITIISLGEYAFGISKSRHRAELEAWLDALLLKVDVLLLEQKTLPFYAEVRGRLKVAGTPIPANDCWIAALAQQHRLPIVSQDRHFDSVNGIQRIGW